MKKTTLLCVLLTVPLFMFGQNLHAIDSLIKSSEKLSDSKERVDIYNAIAFEYSGLDSANTVLYLLKATEIAESIDYEEGKADALFIRGRDAMLSGYYGSAALHLDQLLKLSKSLEYAKGMADGFFAMGWLSYYRGNYDEAVEYFFQSLELRNELGVQADVSDCLQGIGITYKLKGDFDNALYYLTRSLAIEQKINNPEGIATCLNHIGIINSLRGDYAFALDFYFQALDIQEKLGDRSGLAYTFQNIGVIYEHQQDYEKALDYYNKSLTIREEIGERRGIAQVISNIGIVYHKQHNYERALEYYSNALGIKESLGDKRGMADGHLNIGKLYADEGKHQDAIYHKLQSLKISSETDSDWGKVYALISLGQSHHDTGEYREAREYLKKGIDLAKAARLQENVMEGVKLLASVEENLGQYKEAYSALRNYQKLSDSLATNETTRKITRLEAEHEFQQEKDSMQFANEKEKLLLDRKIDVQREVQFAFIVAVIVLVMILAILYRYYRLKNVSNHKLALLNDEIKERNESLKTLNEEKNNIIGVVAHDLQNPLAGIIGAVDLMEVDKLDEDQKKLIEIIGGYSGRMHKMVTDILSVEALEKNPEIIDPKPFDFSAEAKSVCERFAGQAESKQLKVNMAIEEGVVVMADERYVGQIIENILSNAVKFSPAGKEIHVSLSKGEGVAVLEIRDQGPGLSADDKKKLFQKFQKLSAKPTGNESSTGLGLSIVKGFVERMGGAIWCQSESGKGASFFVELKLAS